MDTFTPANRSELMARVRRVSTRGEIVVRGVLRAHGIRFRSQGRGLPGTPDFVVPSARLVIFVDGDFWHGRWWFQAGIAPRTNRAFWIRKFERNRTRDVRVDRQLRRAGWSVVRVWESDIRRDAAVFTRLLLARVRARQRCEKVSIGSN